MVIPPAPTPQKRWPPAVATVAAFVLVFLVLPNPLRIPQNNPTASAEYAPVPGHTDQSNDANFSEIDQGSSAGIGAGGQGEGLLSGQPPPPPPPVYKPRQKECIGEPPRQTEDPLSPPCVPFFEDDNGGATYTGVSKNEIKVVLYNDLGVRGDMNQPWSPSDEAQDAESNYEHTYLVRTIKAMLRYFNSRYQTYGRVVHVIAQASKGGLSAPCSQRAGDAARTLVEQRPFAAVHLGDNGQCYMEYLATKARTPSFGLNSDVQRSRYETHRPYIWGFFPDQEAEAAWSASFICRKLSQGGNGKASFAQGLLKDKPRRFGFIRPVKSQRGPEAEQLSKLLVADLKKECGLSFYDTQTYDAGKSGAGSQEAPNIIRRFQGEDITTVVCYCVPVQTELTVSTMQNTATTNAYFPEWYWDHMSRMFRAIWERTYGDKNQHNFGVSQHWRQPAYRDQYHYQAYLSQEPDSVPNTRFNFDIYHLFLNLFQAIQAAGPNLSPDSVETGMFTFAYTDRRNPFVPAGGYGSYNARAIATYTFVDTAMGWWWDPTGTAPGGKKRDGCLRVINQGLRSYPGAWPAGDTDIHFGTAKDPCSQDDTQIAQAQAGDF